MHVGGEEDVRGAYCALAVATLTNILSQELFDKTAEWVMRYAQDKIFLTLYRVIPHEIDKGPFGL